MEIPYEEISTLLAIEVFNRLKPTLDLRPTEETFKVDMRALRLVPQEVIHDSLTRDCPASPLEGNPNYQYGQIWGGENSGPKANRAYADMHQWIAREFQIAVTKSVKNWANAQNGFFRNFITDSMKKADRGPLYLAALIKSNNEWSIIPTLTRMAEQCDGIAANCMSQSKEIEAKLASSYNAGHGKLLNRAAYVNGYLSALQQWAINENATYVYPQRAEAIRELRDRLQIYHDKVFSKLGDVLEALPDIFRQNFEYMSIAEREAEREGRLEDDTRLIWPLKYLQTKKGSTRDFEKLLDESVTGFLDNMTVNLGRWTGCDLDSLEDASSGTDVPGFISQFISQQFGGLLTINMEDILRSKEGADDLDLYLRGTLPTLITKSVPMFSMRQQFKTATTAQFGLTSVPFDCLEILTAAKNYIKTDKVFVKTSKEKTRLYFVKVMSGFPLYAYAKMEDMEKDYETARKNKITRDGTHLYGKWWDDFPTPLPEASWSPSVYSNPTVKSYNDSIREAFNFCMNNNIIRVDNPDAPTKLFLHIADPKKADPANIEFPEGASLKELVDILKEERDNLWDENSRELVGMGITSGGTYVDTVRESVLRLPKVAAEIKRQSEIAMLFADKEKELGDPSTFASALMCGLVVKQGFKVVLKRSISSNTSEMLYDTTEERTFAEFETYKEFRKFLTDARRDEMETLRREMLNRIANDPVEMKKVLEIVEENAKKYAAVLLDIKGRIERTAIDKRKPLKDTQAFYASVLSIMETYRDKYLV
jgi:hypothetical protein